MKRVIILLSIAAVITGCSSTPAEQLLESFLEATGTKKSQRTVDWYYENDYKRLDVLNQCGVIYEEKALHDNIKGANVVDNSERYYNEDVRDKYYKSNTDCWNALQAQDRLDDFRANHAVQEEVVEPEVDLSKYINEGIPDEAYIGEPVVSQEYENLESSPLLDPETTAQPQ